MIKVTKNNCSAPALENTLRIINYMSQRINESFGISELSRLLDISNNMTYRIMSILTDYRYTQLDLSGKYRLGSKFYSIGMKLKERLSLENCIYPWLDQLCKTTGEVSHVQIEDGSRCLLTASSVPDSDFYFYVKLGSRLYYHANAFGKAILAFLDEKRFRTAISEGLVKLTQNTVTTLDELNVLLNETRRTGIAYDLEEYNSGIYCVGAPIFDVNGDVIAGTGIVGFVSSLDENGCKIFRKPVLECAKNISYSLGYDGKRFDEWIKLLEDEEK